VLQETARYEIRLKGHLDDRWAVRFGGMRVTRHHDSDGYPVTILSGPVIDQSALHGMLAVIRDIGIPVVSITQIKENEKGGTNG
jgi:hypothetical protein